MIIIGELINASRKIIAEAPDRLRYDAGGRHSSKNIGELDASGKISVYFSRACVSETVHYKSIFMVTISRQERFLSISLNLLLFCVKATGLTAGVL